MRSNVLPQLFNVSADQISYSFTAHWELAEPRVQAVIPLSVHAQLLRREGEQRADIICTDACSR